jgi:3-hydroxyisobutyrate dehydrogenase-like beta-hydroxyacid dehydrogenase
MRIAVIAPGAMGAAVAQLARARGADVAVTLEGRGPASAARAAGLALLPDETALAAWADVVLSILPPGEALALAERLAPALKARQDKPVYVDCNAVSPGTVRLVAAALRGVRFCDVGIIGGPPNPAADTAGEVTGPRFYGSGEPNEDLRALRDVGIDFRPIDGGVGAASALKMSYAGITKGLTALGSTMALGAAQAGAAAALRAELAESQPELVRYLDRSVPDMFAKAYRWVAEMEEIEAFLDGNPGAPIYLGAARLYEAIATDRAAPTGAGDGSVATLTKFWRRPDASA